MFCPHVGSATQGKFTTTSREKNAEILHFSHHRLWANYGDEGGRWVRRERDGREGWERGWERGREEGRQDRN